MEKNTKKMVTSRQNKKTAAVTGNFMTVQQRKRLEGTKGNRKDVVMRKRKNPM